MKRWGWIPGVNLTLASSVFAQERPRPAEIDYETAHLSRIAAAVRVSERIMVDGRLDERAWELATSVGQFTQRRPRTGEPNTSR